MQRSQQITLLVVLSAVMVVIYARNLRPPVSKASSSTAAHAPDTANTTATDTKQPTTTPLDQAVPKGRSAQRQRSRELTWRRDPFTRGAAAPGVGGLTLSGILWDPDKALAIINGETVSVGQELGGYKVIAIARDYVSVSDGNETFRLYTSP